MKRDADPRTMIHISDADFFAALSQKQKGVKKVVRLAKAKDYTAAWQALADHYKAGERQILDHRYSARLSGTGRKRAEVKEIIAQADRLVRHEIKGWHSTTFKFGKSMDFNADFGESGIYGFHYFGWLLPLGHAYALTGQGTYAAAFDDIFSQWYDQRDGVAYRIEGLDPIWNELGLGVRLPRFMSLYDEFSGAAELRLETVAKIWKTLLGHGRRLREHELRGYRNGNWQVAGCRALLWVGFFFPEFRESASWAHLGLKRLMEHCERDFFDDGCYSERCPGYGTIGLRFLPELYELLGRRKGHTAERRKLKARMSSAYRWYMLTSTPLCTMPATGDCGHADISGLLKTGARHTGDGTLLWPVRAGLSAEEKRSLPKPAEPRETSVNLAPSGFAVMRGGWRRDDPYMIINYGPSGGGHTHNHALDFELFAHGEGLALDTSRFDSYDNPLDAHFRRAVAHNQVVVNDADMDREELKVTDVAWQSNKRADLFCASHDGYLKSHGVAISRKVVFVKPHYWFISDFVEEHQRHHCYTWFLHSPLRFKSGKGKRFTAGRGPGLLVVPARPAEIRHLPRGVDYIKDDRRTRGTFPERRWIGYRKFSHRLDFATFAVMLVPFKKNAPDVSLQPVGVTRGGQDVSRREAEAFEVRIGSRRMLVVISHAEAVRRQYGPVQTGCRIGLFEKRGKRWVGLARV
ncbi:MAG: heparinase II/III family protein [Planctomycetia bacterium]|nr:heparinase II/III family protein [Planctomycetia bacterium]